MEHQIKGNDFSPGQAKASHQQQQQKQRDFVLEDKDNNITTSTNTITGTITPAPAISSIVDIQPSTATVLATISESEENKFLASDDQSKAVHFSSIIEKYTDIPVLGPNILNTNKDTSNILPFTTTTSTSTTSTVTNIKTPTNEVRPLIYSTISSSKVLHDMAKAQIEMGMKAPVAVQEQVDSSEDDSESYPGPSSTIIRKLSTKRDIQSENATTIKEGYLFKQTSSFQRWHRRYFKIKGKTLYYAKTEKALIFDEISLTDVIIADCTSKSFRNCFQVIVPTRVLALATERSKDMEDWITAIKTSSNSTSFYEPGDHEGILSGNGVHTWYATSHAKPTFCNVCKEQLCGVTSNGLSCEICKFKAHKRCANKAINNCKWTTLASMGKEIIEEADGRIHQPHQWLEGNLPVSAKCEICEKTCGSVMRLTDFRCLFCRACVHTGCKPNMPYKCPLGKISVVPPSYFHTIGTDDAWETSSLKVFKSCSPLLVFVNSKSGDRKGLKFLRRFKQLLNPAQVFDLMNGGPRLGLKLFRHFEPFRILVCGGDGSVGWVLSEIDKLDMHRQCQVGVLPLGTGNDLARVLGWGSSSDDDAHLPQLLDKYEKATIKMLDRWSIMTFERVVLLKPNTDENVLSLQSETVEVDQDKPKYDSSYCDIVASHLQNILQSDQHQTVISSAGFLCETVRDMIGKIGNNSCDKEIDEKCAMLSQKLDSLLKTLHEETENIEEEVEDLEETEDLKLESTNISPSEKKITKFRQRETLMSRANSLKKAVRQIIEHADKALEESTPIPVVVVRPMTLAMQQSGEMIEHDEIEFDKVKILAKLNDDKNFSPLSPIEMDCCPKIIQSDADDDDEVEEDIEIDDEEIDIQIDEENENVRDEIEGEKKVQRDHNQSEKDFPLLDHENYDGDKTLMNATTYTSISDGNENENESREVIPIKIEVDSPTPSDKSSTKLIAPSILIPNLLNVPDNTCGGGGLIPRGSSPRASRRISMGCLLKPLEVEIPKSPSSGSDSESYFQSLSPFSGASGTSSGVPSLSASPNKHHNNGARRKTLPIINPLINHPSWPSISSSAGLGGIIQNSICAVADVAGAVASPLMDLDDPDDNQRFQERCIMNNYFGIGIDAKISLDFHLKREEHPEKCRSRTKNFMWYGVLGSKELLQKSCKNLEKRVQLECDGKRLPLPSLQGIVILNIQSWSGGTNFWGGTKEDDCFLAPSFDDKILEVVAVFDSMQMAASRLISLQHHRIAQCHSIKITLLGDDPIPIQVDGEAWLQPPGIIKIVHKNRMQMLCRNRALEASLKSWDEKQKHHSSSSPTPTTENDEYEKKRHSRRGIFKLKFHRKEKQRSGDLTPTETEGTSEGNSEELSVDHWSASEVAEWLDHLQLPEYKTPFLRHDIRGEELITLQRRDLKELGVIKVGHIKRILIGIENLKKCEKKS